MLSISEENYLKAIYKWQTINNSSVSTNQIAEELSTKPASVTDMIKKLSEKKYCSYIKYKGVSLTETGFKIAVNIVRKHRLWEFFLVEKLGFGWEKVHAIAEQLEHIDSPELVEKLDFFLQFPKWDPHGNPIPNKKGELPKRKNKLLTSCKIGGRYVLLGVKNDTPPFLTYLNKVELQLGTELIIEDFHDFDGSFLVRFNNKNIQISNQVANSLIVEKK